MLASSFPIHYGVLFAVALSAYVAVYIWGRSARRLGRSHGRMKRDLESGRVSEEAVALSRASYLKDLHVTGLYFVIGTGALMASLVPKRIAEWASLVIAIPVGVSLFQRKELIAADRLAEERASIERRAEEVLAQQELAPMKWSQRLAPDELPEIEGFEIGHVYQPGAGAMAGDFYDIFPVAQGRLVAAIGDVTGHGVEPSITAFQVKNLLRVFLHQYRDPAQAMEELNAVVSAQGKAQGRYEEMVSVCVVVFDQAAGALRFASAGHPPAWLYHAGEVRPLRSTGPLLALDQKASYFSREIPMESGDVLLLYTDGIAEARSGEQLFGEDRVAQVLRRDPYQDVSGMCANLLTAAREFAAEPLGDDVALLAVRCS